MTKWDNKLGQLLQIRLHTSSYGENFLKKFINLLIQLFFICDVFPVFTKNFQLILLRFCINNLNQALLNISHIHFIRHYHLLNFMINSNLHHNLLSILSSRLNNCLKNKENIALKSPATNLMMYSGIENLMINIKGPSHTAR